MIVFCILYLSIHDFRLIQSYYTAIELQSLKQRLLLWKSNSKFGLSADKNVNFALYSDGTEIDDFEYDVMNHFANSDTIITLLLDGEHWTPVNSVFLISKLIIKL